MKRHFGNISCTRKALEPMGYPSFGDLLNDTVQAVHARGEDVEITNSFT